LIPFGHPRLWGAPSAKSRLIVIGASAGGIEALQCLPLPEDGGPDPVSKISHRHRAYAERAAAAEANAYTLRDFLLQLSTEDRAADQPEELPQTG
jgi:chemotaxis response regulator CheB